MKFECVFFSLFALQQYTMECSIQRILFQFSNRFSRQKCMIFNANWKYTIWSTWNHDGIMLSLRFISLNFLFQKKIVKCGVVMNECGAASFNIFFFVWNFIQFDWIHVTLFDYNLHELNCRPILWFAIVYGARVQLTQAEQTNGFNTISLIQSIV